MVMDKWAALEGRWKFTGAEARYLGPSKPESPLPYGLALGSIPFRDGKIRTRVRIKTTELTTAGIVIGYQSMNAEWISVQIGAYERAYAISIYRPGKGWEAIAAAGLLSNVAVDLDHSLEVGVAGQRVTMTVDDVGVLTHVVPRPLEGTGAGLFAWGTEEIVFARTEVTTVQPRIFVIMPFSEPFDTLYREVIRPVAEALNFEIVRVDELVGPGIIIDDIQRQISQSNAVVAEISSRNPNVFYELGYAHALEKPAVLLARREASGEVPFDIRGYRAIFYDDTIGGKKAVERSLRRHLEAVLGNASAPTQPTVA